LVNNLQDSKYSQEITLENRTQELKDLALTDRFTGFQTVGA